MVRETSIAVYRQIEAEGLLSKRRWEVYDTIFKHGPMSIGMVCEILSKLKIDSRSISPRFAELKEMGVIKEVYEGTCQATGRQVIFVDVTSKLPVKLNKEQKKTKNQIIEELKQENALLRKQIQQFQDPFGLNAFQKQLGFDLGFKK